MVTESFLFDRSLWKKVVLATLKRIHVFPAVILCRVRVGVVNVIIM